jgi:hypothetical protein
LHHNSKKLSTAQKSGALKSFMYLKEKRDGSIKGRACADARKKRETVIPGEAALPTVSLESVLITAAVEACEGRYIAVVDVHGTFIREDMDEEFLMTLMGAVGITNGEDHTKHLSKLYNLGFQQSTSVVCAVAEGTIWIPAKCAFVQQEYREGPQG